MKKSLFITSLFFAFLVSFNASATGPYKLKFDSLSCLQVEGRVTNVEEVPEGECVVELISDNEVLESIVLKEGKTKFKFVLDKNAFYSIRLSQKGFITKLISVDTKMLTEIEAIHLFKFETTLMEERLVGKLNQDVIDFPVTIIHYDYEMESFTYNMEYTAYIKKELYKPTPSAKTKKAKNVYILNTTDLAFVSR